MQPSQNQGDSERLLGSLDRPLLPRRAGRAAAGTRRAKHGKSPRIARERGPAMTTPNADLVRVLDDLAARVPGIEAVVMLRRDGVVVAASGGLTSADTERLAAIAASFGSLAKDATGYFEDGRVVRVLLDLA